MIDAVSLWIVYDTSNRYYACGYRSESSNESSLEPELISNSNVPIYDIPKAQYSAETVISMLLDPDDTKICSERPTTITQSSTFVINLDSLEHPDDAKKDNFGKWVHSGSHTIPFKSWFSEDGAVMFERLQPGSTGPDVQFLHRINSYHPSNSSCKRMLAFITGELPVCLFFK